MNIKFILYYRFLCLILALGYWSYQFTLTNYDNFGIQFRFLTIWGLSAALTSTILLFINSLKGREEKYFAIVSATAVLNAMVVFLYWKLYFIDPSLVNYSGSITWFQEYYLRWNSRSNDHNAPRDKCLLHSMSERRDPALRWIVP